MAFEGDYNDDQVSCTIYHNKDDGRQPKKVVSQLYLAKINNFSPNSTLQANFDDVKKAEEQISKRKTRLLNKIRASKAKLESLEREIHGRNYCAEVILVKSYRRLLEEHWPETINEDLEEESDPDIELLEIKEKIPTLTEQLGHGKTNWAKEKQILKEVEHLHRRKELLDREVKEAEAKIPKPTKWGYWCCGSKYDLKRQIRGCLKIIKAHEERKNVAYMRHKDEIMAIEKKLASLEKRYNIVCQEEEKAKDFLSALEVQVK